MSATNTPLRLNNYFFPVVQVIANPKYENAEEQPEPRFRITPSIAKNDENGLYQVSVDIHLLQEDEKVPVPYSIHLVAFGFFEVHPEWLEPEKLLFINGSTILYAAARKQLFVYMRRGRGISGAFFQEATGRRFFGGHCSPQAPHKKRKRDKVWGIKKGT
jgi:preprotein translocase subunit SecB